MYSFLVPRHFFQFCVCFENGSSNFNICICEFALNTGSPIKFSGWPGSLRIFYTSGFYLILSFKCWIHFWLLANVGLHLDSRDHGIRFMLDLFLIHPRLYDQPNSSLVLCATRSRDEKRVFLNFILPGYVQHFQDFLSLISECHAESGSYCQIEITQLIFNTLINLFYVTS